MDGYGHNLKYLDENILWLKGVFPGAALYFGSIIGFLIGGWISQYLGKRIMLVASNLCSSVIWIFLAFTKVSVDLIIIERFSMGILSAAAGGCIGAYISETSQTKLRSIFGTFQVSGTMLGYLLANLMGVVFNDWRNSALALAVVPLLGSMTMLLFPETPYWLASVGRFQESRYHQS